MGCQLDYKDRFYAIKGLDRSSNDNTLGVQHSVNVRSSFWNSSNVGLATMVFVAVLVEVIDNGYS